MKSPRWSGPGFILMAAFIGLLVYLADTGQSSAWAFLQSVPWGDKIGHFFLFGGLTFFSCLTWPDWRARVGRFSFPKVVIPILAFAVIEEISQAWIPGRTLDGGDLAADLLGMATAVFLSGRISRRGRPPERSAGQ